MTTSSHKNDFVLESTLSRVFLKRIQESPKQSAFAFRSQDSSIAPLNSWVHLNYEEYSQLVYSVAQFIHQLGLSQQSKIAILSKTRVEWTLTDWAILANRMVTVPLYPSLLAHEIEYILTHSESKVVFVENKEQLQKIISTPSLMSKLDQIIVFESDEKDLDHPKVFSWKKIFQEKVTLSSIDTFQHHLAHASLEDVITITYTSGTTGVPKGVVLTQQNMISVLIDCVTVLGDFVVPNRERVLSFLPISHIMGKVESVAGFVFGWETFYAKDLSILTRELKDVKPTLIFAVPRIFEKAYQQIQMKLQSSSLLLRKGFNLTLKLSESLYLNKKDSTGAKKLASQKIFHFLKGSFLSQIQNEFGGKLKYAICGGAPLSVEAAHLFELLGIEVLEGYGLTETCAPVTLNTPRFKKLGTVGKPLPEVALKIAEDGEILIRSNKLFKGYYLSPADTAEALQSGWFHSGDIGEIDSQGYLRITDRKKDLMITSGAKNIAPQKIENLIKSSVSFIQEVVVAGDRRPYLTALITLDSQSLYHYAKEQSILYSSFENLTQHPSVLSRIRLGVEQANEQLPSFEKVKKFLVLDHPFSIETGQLTPSLKVKRNQILNKYQSEISNLYDELDSLMG